MLVKMLPLGQMQTNCYVVTNEKTLQCVVIDPGDESNTVLNYLEENNLKCEAIFLTHSHFDHVGAVEPVRLETGAPVYLHPADDNFTASRFPYRLPEGGKHYNDGDVLEIAGLRFEIIGTPGHTPGGVTIKCESSLFTGDTLFKGSCGRVDFPGGDLDVMLSSLKKLCLIPGEYDVYPGHMDSSTLERERQFNYYCRAALSR